MKYHHAAHVNSVIAGAPRREVYFIGLTDVLTQYDTKKKAAHAARAVKQGVRDLLKGFLSPITLPYLKSTN